VRAMTLTGLGKCGDVSFHSIQPSRPQRTQPSAPQPSLPQSRASGAAVLGRGATPRHDNSCSRHYSNCSIFLSCLPISKVQGLGGSSAAFWMAKAKERSIWPRARYRDKRAMTT
jgi:hypothetical protein